MAKRAQEKSLSHKRGENHASYHHENDPNTGNPNRFIVTISLTITEWNFKISLNYFLYDSFESNSSFSDGFKE